MRLLRRKAKAKWAVPRTPAASCFPAICCSPGRSGGRDLPGGDYPTILRSLARVCLTLPDETIVLSGHGPQTTIGDERRANPFLAGLTPPSGPSRGL